MTPDEKATVLQAILIELGVKPHYRFAMMVQYLYTHHMTKAAELNATRGGITERKIAPLVYENKVHFKNFVKQYLAQAAMDKLDGK